MSALPATRFDLPEHAEAVSPPEARGLARDGVRLLVAAGRPDGTTAVEHARFRDLPGLLAPGDLLVVNTSATLPAALTAHRDGEELPVHVASALSADAWVVEVRRADGTGPDLRGREGDVLHLEGGVDLELQAPYPDPAVRPSRTWRVAVHPPTPAAPHLAAHGRPIGYRYLAGRFPLRDSQTVFATEPGSAEMPSAGRPFSAELVVRLVSRGVAVAPLLLHTGVSSQEAAEPPLPEPYAVPEATARAVNATRAAGGRVVAVGTTVVRALETVAAEDGTVAPGRGWTDLVLGPQRAARAVTGLVTGLHAPGASHLLLLEAVAGPALVQAAYTAAVGHGGYLWHEFGDSSLLLPGVAARRPQPGV